MKTTKSKPKKTAKQLAARGAELKARAKQNAKIKRAVAKKRAASFGKKVER